MPNASNEKSKTNRWREPQTLLGLVGVIGMVATLSGAVVAYNIQKDNQAMTIFQGYNNAKFVEELRDVSKSIDYELYNNRKSSRGSTENLVKLFSGKFSSQLPEIRENLAEGLKMVYTLSSCTHLHKNSFLEKKYHQFFRPYCDIDTIAYLFGNMLFDWYLNFGPMFYCDNYIKNVYKYDIINFEELMREIFKKRKFMTFLNEEDVGYFKGDYIILRVPEKYCKFYPNWGN